MSIFITGDTHGSGTYTADGFRSRFSFSNFPEQKEMTKSDFVIICGDFGGVWETNRAAFEECADEKRDLDWLESRPFTTLFVPGNHENYDRLTGIKDERLLSSWVYETMPETEKEKFRKGYPRAARYGGTVRVIRPSVLMLEPGVFDLGGFKVFAYGGAQSHDIRDGILDPADFPDEASFRKAARRMNEENRMFRIKGLSWWEQEIPGMEEENVAREALKKNGNRVDFIVTHDCAASDRALVGYAGGMCALNGFLEEIKNGVSYRHWFFGHYHGDRDMPGGKEHLIYRRIVQVA